MGAAGCQRRSRLTTWQARCPRVLWRIPRRALTSGVSVTARNTHPAAATTLILRALLGHSAPKRLHLEQLPGCAPDLTPNDGIQNYFTRVELATAAAAI